jgi:hypothetical protein
MAMNTTGLSIGSSTRSDSVTLLAIDDQSLPIRKNVRLTISTPQVRTEPVLGPTSEPGAPDDAATHFYGTVLRDDGMFRMWYYACHWGMNPDWSPRMMQQIAKKPPWVEKDMELYQGPLCYAESDDGITWRKPDLGQVLFKGNRKNNAIALPHTIVSGATVIKDSDDPDPGRRYKMVYQYFPDQTDPVIPEYGTLPSIATAVSPDGLSWTVTGIPYCGEFVEHSSFYRFDGRYIVNYQSFGTQGGEPHGRTGMVKVATDFDTWIDGQAPSFALPEPDEQGINGAFDQVHLGVGAYAMDSVCVGLYGLWHNAEFHSSFDQISCELGLVVSNDGIRFREPVKGHHFIGTRDSLVTPVPGHEYRTVLCQANGILSVGDETRIYHGRWRNTGMAPETFSDYTAEVALATIPRDRWGCLRLEPGSPDGLIWSDTIALPHSDWRMTVNGDDLAGVRIELADTEFKPIPEYSGDSAGTFEVPDGLDCPVTWPNGNVAPISSTSVRLCVRLDRNHAPDPKIFAIHIETT